MAAAYAEPTSVGGFNLFAAGACKCLRAVGSLMVLVVLAFVALTFYVTVISAYGHRLLDGGTSALVGAIVIVVYLVLIALLLWSYFATVLTEPGRVPAGWTPCGIDEEDAAETATGGRRRREPRPRFCKKCRQFKPERCHHCSVCGRCVLKMDHHCVWVANCVGAYNYKFFCLFLFWTFCASVFDTCALIPDIVNYFRKDVESEQRIPGITLTLLAFVLDIAFAISVLGFMVMHGNLVQKNLTTIEMYEKKRLLPWKFDYGSRRNFMEVFGPDSAYWFFPLYSPAHKRRLEEIAGILEDSSTVLLSNDSEASEPGSMRAEV